MPPQIPSICPFPGVYCHRIAAVARTRLRLGASNSPLPEYAGRPNDSFQFGGAVFSDSQNSDYMNENDVANQQVLESTIEQILQALRRQELWARRHPLSEKLVHQTLPRIKSKKGKRHLRSTMHDRLCETP